MMTPKITLIGAGPGDPELLTLKGLRRLQDADVVLYDALVDEAILDYAPAAALKISVGKRAGKHTFRQEEINQLLVEFAQSHGHVVRLKGGDPFILARGHEELTAAAEAGIPCEVVPGISSALAAPLLAGVPLTHRGTNYSFRVVSAVTSGGGLSPDVQAAAQAGDTAVVLMGLGRVRQIAALYHAAGFGHLPAAAISEASLGNQCVVATTVDALADAVEAAQLAAPAILVFGEVARFAQATQQAGQSHKMSTEQATHLATHQGAQTASLPEPANPLYPVFLKLDKVPVLIVGGGNVGLEKLGNILRSSPNANVTLVARQLKRAEIRVLAALNPSVRIVERDFAPHDLDSAQLVILATEDRETNAAIRLQAKALGKLVNVADTPDLCDLYLGAIVTKGDLKVAISTNGQSPTFAKRLKEVLNDTLPDSVRELLPSLRRVRDRLRGDFEHKVQQLNALTATLVDTTPQPAPEPAQAPEEPGMQASEVHAAKSAALKTKTLPLDS
jgi:uroporphyrin-III C-methyltransferase